MSQLRTLLERQAVVDPGHPAVDQGHPAVDQEHQAVVDQERPVLVRRVELDRPRAVVALEPPVDLVRPQLAAH